MARFVARRLLYSLPVIVGVVTLVFLLIHLVPGDPVDLMLGDSAQSADKENMRRVLGLDRPLLEQFFLFWRRLAFEGGGLSLSYQRPALALVAQRFGMSLALALPSLAVACAIAFPLGVASARRAGRWSDGVAQGLALFASSVPLFVLAPLATLLFSIRLRWLPVAGSETWAHLILPALCLGLGTSGLLMRTVRGSLLEVMTEDYVRTARAKGLNESRVVYTHALRNASFPILTVLANIFGSLLAGAVITETLFDWPGLGKLFYAAFQARDFPLLQAIVLWIALSYVLTHLAVDVFYAWLDPRVSVDMDSDDAERAR